MPQLAKQLEEARTQVSSLKSQLRDAKEGASEARTQLSALSRAVKKSGLAPEAVKAELDSATEAKALRTQVVCVHAQ